MEPKRVSFKVKDKRYVKYTTYTNAYLNDKRGVVYDMEVRVLELQNGNIKETKTRSFYLAEN